MTDEERYNRMLGMTAEELDALGDAYDNDEITFSEKDVIIEGSPAERLLGHPEIVILDDLDLQGVTEVARRRGCQRSDIYREAVRHYLGTLSIPHS